MQLVAWLGLGVFATEFRSPVGVAGLGIRVGADGPGKQELDPAVLAESKVVVDVLDPVPRRGSSPIRSTRG